MDRAQRPSLRACESVKSARIWSGASVVDADERKGGSVSRDGRIGFATTRAVTIRWHRTLCHGSTEAADPHAANRDHPNKDRNPGGTNRPR